MKKIKWGKT